MASDLFVGLVVAVAGFSHTLPQIEDLLTPALKIVAILCYCIVPIFGWLLSLRSMKHYELDKEKMREINLKNLYEEEESKNAKILKDRFLREESKTEGDCGKDMHKNP